MKERFNRQINENSIIKVHIQLMTLPMYKLRHKNLENKHANSTITVECRQHIKANYPLRSAI